MRYFNPSFFAPQKQQPSTLGSVTVIAPRGRSVSGFREPDVTLNGHYSSRTLDIPRSGPGTHRADKGLVYHAGTGHGKADAANVRCGTIRRCFVEMPSGSGPTRSRSWLLSTVTLLLLTSCATTRLAEEDQPPKAEALDIGYGKIDEGHLVGSVSTVYGEDSRITGPRTMIEMLARLPGVQVKESRIGGLSILVRGAGPLYVVDGMIFHGSINSIDPNTVESISVLKNAGETAIYGSRVGHGGVILIRTKKGGAK